MAVLVDMAPFYRAPEIPPRPGRIPPTPVTAAREVRLYQLLTAIFIRFTWDTVRPCKGLFLGPSGERLENACGPLRFCIMDMIVGPATKAPTGHKWLCCDLNDH